MLHRLAFASLLGAALVAPVFADMDIVVDNFDSYADTAALLAVWGETTGNGTAAASVTDQNSGILTTDATTFPEILGQAVDHIGSAANTPGMVNQWGGVIDQANSISPAFTINPSASQSIVLKADIYFANNGNERMTVGMRSIDNSSGSVVTQNIFEMGAYNANPVTPEGQQPVPGAPTVGTHFAYRLINFGAVTDPITYQPNWQYFTLAPELDRTTDTDTLTNLGDIGAGWHTYTATFTPESVTLALDLFRDGKTNLTRVDGTGAIEVGVGADGVDASITYQIATLPSGFNSLRLGGPSGLTSPGAGASAFDNISLRLVDIATPTDNADFDQDGDVDGRDFLIWQRGFGTPDAVLQDGDANEDHVVDGLDLAVWQDQYGQPGALSAITAVPEPGTALLLVAATAMLAIRRK